MSRASALTNPGAASSAPDMTIVAQAVQRLQAEYDAAPSAVAQALLLHEIAVLEERLGEEAESIRDHLGATDAEPSFHEPLERLSGVIARRGSSRLLGRLLERLGRIAESPLERARAFLDHAANLADRDNDLEAARKALEAAAEATHGDPAVWLSLEYLAGRLSDASLAERALGERAELAEKSEFRALLLMDLAERLAERGDIEGALGKLEQARGLESTVSYAVSRALERLGSRADRPDVVGEALEAQARFVRDAVRDPAAGDARGVPSTRRSLAEAADAWLRAAELNRRIDPDGAAELVDRALEALPDSPLLARVRLELFDAVGDVKGAESFLQARLERGHLPAALASAFWLRLARAADAEGDRPRAHAALERALELAPDGVVARALELEWAEAEGDLAALSRALDRAAAIAPEGPAQIQAALSLADLRGRRLKDTSGAEAALTRAREAGASAERVIGLARLIAVAANDPALAERVTRAHAEHIENPEERAAAYFDLARTAAARGDSAQMQAALARLADNESSSWLGRVLGAYASPPGSPPDVERTEQAMLALASTEPDAATARALRLVLAARAVRRGAVEVARDALEELGRDAAGDLVVTSALSALLAESDRPRAANLLLGAARAHAQPDVSRALELASGVLAFRSGDKQRALESFERAAEHKPAGGVGLLGWALAESTADDPRLRRRALEALAVTAPDLAALERFALEVGKGEDPEAAISALDRLRSAEDPELRRAGDLAGALDGPGEAGAVPRRQALEAVADWSPEAARLSRALSHQLELVATPAGAAPDPERTRVSASRWAATDPGIAPVLEWLSAAIAAHDVVDEVAARRALAERLSNGVSESILASAALAAELGGLDATFAPEADSPAAQLVELELSAPGRGPERRARALERAAPLLGDDAAFTALVLAGYNQLAARDLDAAIQTFRRAVEELPEEVVGWEGLRAAALAAGDRETLAEACAALGDAVSDGSLGARLWEEAAAILLDELGDAERGEFALTRAVERDIRRQSAFQRAFRAIRARKDHPRLIELIDRRLGVAEEPAELVKLLWERSRAQRELGDREGARRTLEQVQALDPEHVGALALSGEIHLALGRFEPAAESLSRLSQSPQAPAEQRLMSGMAAADVYESRLDDPQRAFLVLSALERTGLGNLVVRERLARTGVKSGHHLDAARALEQLMLEREDSDGRATAARLAVAIYREKLGRPAEAERAVTALLGEVPDDPEGLDLVLSGVFQPEVGDPLLERGLKALVQKLSIAPFDRDNVERLARVSAELGLAARRQAALGVLVALGADKSRVDPELWALDRNVAHTPQSVISETQLPQLVDPEDHGPVGELLRLLDGTFIEALGPNLSSLGLGRRERVDARAGTPLRNEVASWAAALGIEDFELYVGGPDPEGVLAIGTEKPALVVGSAVTSPFTPRQRQAVARALFAIRRGMASLLDREPADVRSLVVAALRTAELDPPFPGSANDAEYQRRIQREIPRKARRALPEVAARVLASGQDPAVYYRAARSTLDRLGVVAAGDASWVLAQTVATRGDEPHGPEEKERARRLLGFVLTDAYLELRERLGMGVR